MRAIPSISVEKIKIFKVLSVTLLIAIGTYSAFALSTTPTILGVSGSITSDSIITISGTDFGTKAQTAPVLWDYGDSVYENGVQNDVRKNASNNSKILRPDTLYEKSSISDFYNASESPELTRDLTERHTGMSSHYFLPSGNTFLGWPNAYGGTQNTPTDNQQLYVSWWFKEKYQGMDYFAMKSMGMTGSFIPGEALITSNSLTGTYIGMRDDRNNGDRMHALIYGTTNSSALRNSTITGLTSGATMLTSGNGNDYYIPGSTKFIRIWERDWASDIYEAQKFLSTFSNGTMVARKADSTNVRDDVRIYLDGGIWHHMETTVDLDANIMEAKVDGKITNTMDITEAVRVDGLYSPTMALLGFNGQEYFNSSELGEIYMDSSLQKVILSDAPTWNPNIESHTEIQYVTNWTDNSISLKVYQGSFGNTQDVYAYIMKEDGTINSNGYQITFGSGVITPDTTPDSLSIPVKINQIRNASIISDSFKVTGINIPTSISITNGTYNINGGAFTSNVGIVNNNDTILMKVTSSTGFNSLVQGILNIGGVNFTFNVTTEQQTLKPIINTLSGSIINGGSITLTGTGFQTGPNVLVFDDFENGTIGNTIPLNQATVGTWTTQNQYYLPKYMTGGRSGNNAADMWTLSSYSGSTQWAKAELQKIFTPTTEVYFSYAVKVPDGKYFPGAGVTAPVQFSTDSSWKFAWLYYDADGFTGKNDLIFPSHSQGDGRFQIGGNDGLILSDVSDLGGTGAAWWKWGKWKRMSSWVRADDINPSTGSGELYFQVVNTVDDMFELTMNDKPLFDTDTKEGEEFAWDRINIPGWARDTTEEQTGMMYDDIYIATGDSAAARIEIGDNSSYELSKKLAISTPTSWSNDQITFNFRQGDLVNGPAYLFVIDKNNNVSSAYPVTIGGPVLPPDTIPDSFNFVGVTGQALNTDITSNSITVAGIDTVTPISITNGTYSVNAGVFTSSAGIVNLGDVITVKNTSSSSYSTLTTTSLNIGGVTADFDVTTQNAPIIIPTDTIPDSFGFAPSTFQTINTEITSGMITVTGINTLSPISIINGTYSINGAAYTSVSGTVNLGDTVSLKNMSSSNYSTLTTTSVDIGGVSADFNVTTGPMLIIPNTTPDIFTFTGVVDQNLSTDIVSNNITVSGMNTPTPISVINGTYSINGTAYTSASGTVNLGDTISLKNTSSSNYSTLTKTTLNIGGVSSDFDVITKNMPTNPVISTLSGTVDNGSSITISGTGFLDKINAKPFFVWRADDGVLPNGTLGRQSTWDGTFNGELVSRTDSGVVIADGSSQAVRMDYGESEGAILGKVSFNSDNLYVWRKRYDDFDADYAYAIRTRIINMNQLVAGQSFETGVIMANADKSIIGQSNSVKISGTTATIYYNRTFGNINDISYVKGKITNGDNVYFYAATDTGLTTPIYEATINEGYGVFYTFNHKTIRFWGKYPTAQNNTYISLGDGIDSPLTLRAMAVNERTQVSTFWGKLWDRQLDHATKRWVREEYQYQVGDIDVENGILNYWQDGVVGWSNKKFRFRTSAYPTKYSDLFMNQVSNGAQKGSYEYYDSLYVDDSWSKIILCESNTFENCTKREIQYPSTWNNNQITFTFNKGEFLSGIKYLFVIDKNNNPSVGYPISLGSAVVPIPGDTTPDVFTFTGVLDQSINTETISGIITVTGINTLSPISIINGTYSINGAAYTSASGTINLGDTVSLKNTSSSNYSTLTTTSVDIGGISADFNVTTQSAPVIQRSGGGGGGSSSRRHKKTSSVQEIIVDTNNTTTATGSKYYELIKSNIFKKKRIIDTRSNHTYFKYTSKYDKINKIGISIDNIIAKKTNINEEIELSSARENDPNTIYKLRNKVLRQLDSYINVKKYSIRDIHYAIKIKIIKKNIYNTVRLMKNELKSL